MFTKIKNIDTAFRHVRSFSLLLVTGCFGLCGLVLYKSYELSAKVQERVYILSGDLALEAYAGTRKDNMSVEARSHVKLFHQFFFTLDPDEKMIDAGISKALYMADGSAKNQYNSLRETGYYASVISGNISQQITVDSVAVSLQKEPYFFTCYATIRIIRPNSISTRILITQGSLRNVARSDHNPHGFLIEHWETIDNKDIKTENR